VSIDIFQVHFSRPMISLEARFFGLKRSGPHLTSAVTPPRDPVGRRFPHPTVGWGVSGTPSPHHNRFSIDDFGVTILSQSVDLYSASPANPLMRSTHTPCGQKCL